MAESGGGAVGQPAPSPSANGSGGSLYSLPAGSGAEPRPPKWFLAFYRCQMAFPVITHTHTHTRLTVPFPGLPGWAGTRKVKPIWILLKQETVSGSGIS